MKKFLVAIMLTFTFSGLLNADVVQDQKVYAATNVVKAFSCNHNMKIPYDYIREAKAVAIFPSMRSHAAGVSYKRGEGIFVMKDFNGEWTSPIFLQYKGFGLGIQLGDTASDLIVVFHNSRAFSKIFDSLDVSSLFAGAAFAGAGATKKISSDFPDVAAWMSSTGKATGFFAGVGTEIGRFHIDNASMNDYYEKLWDIGDILNGSPKDSDYTKALKRTLNEYFGNYQYWCDCKKSNCNLQLKKDRANKEVKTVCSTKN